MIHSKTSPRTRQRQRLLVLPLLVLPFITFGFWALGGGKGTAPQEEEALNLQLPHPSFKEGPENKLSFYELAAAAEKKRREALQADPYFRDSLKGDSAMGGLEKHLFYGEAEGRLPADPLTIAGHGAEEAAEAQLLQKLERLSREVERPTPHQPPVFRTPAGEGSLDKSIERLEGLMQLMQEDRSGDRDLAQLSSLLEKMIEVQHPQREGEKLLAAQEASEDSFPILAPQPLPVQRDTGFYSLQEALPTGVSPIIRAVIHGRQTLANGALVKIRLQEALQLEAGEIPLGSFVYGIAQPNGERLSISISSIRHGEALYPVRLAVYDLDGLPGIHMPGAMAGELSRSASQKMLQQLHLPLTAPSLTTQAATAGMDAARSFLSRKAGQAKVTLKDGYQLLLKHNP